MRADSLVIIYQIAPQVVLESFEDGALVLQLQDRRLTELNPTARDVLHFTDGKRSVRAVAELLADEYQISTEEALSDVMELYGQLLDQKILEKVNFHQGKDNTAMNPVSASPCYLHNPDVVLREEDEDGGLLFNPDTNQVKVINSTGLFIWKQFETAQGVASVVAAIQQEFEDVPLEEVAVDVQAFLDEMLQTGFIGTVAEDPKGFLK
jgi:transcriptional regulator of acetoin/glycerol metabolism